MKHTFFTSILLVFFLLGCSSKKSATKEDSISSKVDNAKIQIAFGSCNKAELPNLFWDDILASEPDVFIWGGDNIYATDGNLSEVREMYRNQNAIENYKALKGRTLITGVWDDHDYGMNDAGYEFEGKEASQKAFLDFMGVPENDKRRQQEGTYSSMVLSKPLGSVKIINLDTRYFRSKLKRSDTKGKRYEPDLDPNKTMLGEEQWKWLDQELKNSKADFNLIVSSIQFLSDEHGFEKWGNFPLEVEKMKKILAKSGAKGVIFLSGDRHISEFSKTEIQGVAYPIIDFTSSGLTHAYTNFKGEPNTHRVGDVISTISYGFLELDLASKEVHMKMMGDNGEVLQKMTQKY